MKKYILILLWSFIMQVPFSCAASEHPARTMLIFYSSTCHECLRVENDLMPAITEEFKGKLTIEYRNIADIENYKLLLDLDGKYKRAATNTLPVFYIGGNFLNKKSITSEDIRQFVLSSIQTSREDKQLQGTQQDLLERFKSFRPLAIVGAGIVDGINPCAFTVIVFFISFLALQGYRKKELFIIGLSFIFAVFLTYLLLGVGLFGFLYRLKSFWVITKIFNYSVGAVSVILGILCIYDIFKFKTTANPESMVLQLPKTVKNQIHKVIGLHYRINKLKEAQEAGTKRHILPLLLSALVTGFIVSILEAICTGQMYLPTIAFVLKTTHLKLEAFGYLVLYNIMFVVPLLIIFVLALLGVTSGQFSKVFTKHMLAVKMLMAAMFFGLGMFLLWRF